MSPCGACGLAALSDAGLCARCGHDVDDDELPPVIGAAYRDHLSVLLDNAIKGPDA